MPLLLFHIPLLGLVLVMYIYIYMYVCVCVCNHPAENMLNILQWLNCLLLRICSYSKIMPQFKSIFHLLKDSCSYTVDPKMSFSLCWWQNLQCLQTAGLHITIIALPSVNTQSCLMGTQTGTLMATIYPSSAFSSGRLFFIIHPHQKKRKKTPTVQPRRHTTIASPSDLFI